MNENQTNEIQMSLAADLISACEIGDAEKLRELLKNDLVKYSFYLKKQKETAFFEACYEGHQEIVEILLEHGIKINSEDDFAFAQAATGGHLELLKYLDKQGSDIINCGFEAMLGATLYEHLEVVEYLLEKGVDIHEEGDRVLNKIIEHNQITLFKFLVERNVYSNELLEYALAYSISPLINAIDFTKYLISEKGLSPKTGLMYAQMKKNKDMEFWLESYISNTELNNTLTDELIKQEIPSKRKKI